MNAKTYLSKLNKYIQSNKTKLHEDENSITIHFPSYLKFKETLSISFDKNIWRDINKTNYPFWSLEFYQNEKRYIVKLPEHFLGIVFHYDQKNHLKCMTIDKMVKQEENWCHREIEDEMELKRFFPKRHKIIHEIIQYLSEIEIEKSKNRLEYITGLRSLSYY